MNQRLSYIDFTKGFAIILIVFRHIVTKNAFLANFDVYIKLKLITSKFDIPLFFFLAGITFGISYFHHKPDIDLKTFLFKKNSRILPAYLILSVLSYYAPLLPLFDRFSVDIGLNSIPLYNCFIKPEDAPGQFLWFLYVLAFFYTATAIIMYMNHSSIRLLLFCLVISFVISFFDVTKFLSFNKFCKYYPVFGIGFLCFKYDEQFFYFLNQLRFLLIALFVLSIPFLGSMDWRVVSLVTIPAILCISRARIFKNEKVLTQLGCYSFSIYIFHMFVITAITYLNNFINIKTDYYIFYVGISAFLGLVIPYLFKKKIIARYVMLDRYF